MPFYVKIRIIKIIRLIKYLKKQLIFLQKPTRKKTQYDLDFAELPKKKV